MIRSFGYLCAVFCLISNVFALTFSAKKYGTYKIGDPYTIKDSQYIPSEVTSLTQAGTATWYGEDFDGNATANDDIFDSKSFTAAHRTLPMPSVVLITNNNNGNKAVAVVNDRGPMTSDSNRIIDVTKKVADVLGFANLGRADVTIEYLPEPSLDLKNGKKFDIAEYNKKYGVNNILPTEVEIDINVAKNLDQASRVGKTAFTQDYIKAFYVQIGVFSVLENAQRIYKTLSHIGKTQVRSESHDMKNYYIIRAGPFQDIKDAEKSQTEIMDSCPDCKPMIVII